MISDLKWIWNPRSKPPKVRPIDRWVCAHIFFFSLFSNKAPHIVKSFERFDTLYGGCQKGEGRSWPLTPSLCINVHHSIILSSFLLYKGSSPSFLSWSLKSPFIHGVFSFPIYSGVVLKEGFKVATSERKQKKEKDHMLTTR